MADVSASLLAEKVVVVDLDGHGFAETGTFHLLMGLERYLLRVSSGLRSCQRCYIVVTRNFQEAVQCRTQ